jgi:homogentisate phytyltransferase / homogentisate geranylgeranyltransferase
MINKILDDIKNQKITITSWILSFVGILFVRLLLESLSSPTYSGVIPSDPYTIIHYGLYFSTVTLTTIVILGWSIKDYAYSYKIVIFGLPLIWIAPLIDIIFSKGDGFKMAYIFNDSKKLIIDYVTFFGPNLNYGATLGIRFGILISLLGIGYIIWKKNVNKWRNITAIFTLYTIIFIFFSMPSIIFKINNFYSTNISSETIVNYFEQIIKNSNLIHNTLHEGPLSVTKLRFIELGFNKLMSQILFIVSFLTSLVIFWNIDKKKFISVAKNSRPERILSYQLLLLSGAGYAYINNLTGTISWVDIIGLICLTISWFSLWMHAVHINDLEDIDIDKISNKNRPLISGSMNKQDMKDIGTFWLTTSLIGSWCAGFYPFFMSLVYICAYYIYSSPPLRLRRFPLVPNFLIAVAGLSTIQAGFFFSSMYKEYQVFPISLSIGILIMIFLAINTKDMKDVEGDSKNGIMTIPTMFPEKGPVIVGICFALSLLLVPFFLKISLMYIFALPMAIIGYKYINKKPYREEPLFYVRFLFLFFVGITYLFIYWLANVYNLV